MRPVSRRQALRITAATGATLAMGGGLAWALFRDAGLHRVSRTRTRMGTQVTITVVHPEVDAARGMVDGAFAEVERLEGILSGYRADTPVTRLAREGIVRAAPPELIEVLGRAQAYAARTDGAFDVTVGPLLDLYRTRWAEDGEAPSRSEVEAALELVDYRKLRVEGRAVSLEEPGMSITLDGIAKGYVVDRALATLAGAGARRALVEAGGDLAGAGGDLSATDEGWPVAIQDPHAAGGSLGVLRLRGSGVASSGDYVHTFADDRSTHHILDPRTGTSPGHTSAVTVLAPTAMDADALSTAGFVLGPQEGIALLEGLEGVEGLLVTKDGRRVATRGWRAGELAG